jgi:hypothetical protein
MSCVGAELQLKEFLAALLLLHLVPTLLLVVKS